MHDLVIRNGKIVDGTGKDARSGDIAIDGGVIAGVGGKAGAARREIDAGGLLVTPGWVDVHTHYDGQVVWDPYVSPSSWHGVTTVIMGNCGVGFAPVKRGSEEYLLNLMDAVEDIPTETLKAGINFEWESFPEYLDALSRIKRVIDVGTHVPHCAVRVYAMGERGARNEDATPDDIAKMASATLAGLKAGALGISTSRTDVHRTKTNEVIPGTYAAVDEVMALGRTLGQAGHGVYEVISDLRGPDASMEWMVQVSKETGRPMSLIALGNGPLGPGTRRLLEFYRRSNAQGARLVNQLGARAPGVLMGLDTSANPFLNLPSYREIAHLSREERVARMRDPQVRARILRECPPEPPSMFNRRDGGFDNLFPLGDPPNYEPAREMCIGERARRAGKAPMEVLYDTLLERDGRELVYTPANYNRQYNLDGLRDLLLDPASVMSASDGGAHCAAICDASMPTFLLSYWVRDRGHNGRIGLEMAVRRQTHDTAQLYGLDDRGVLEPGKKADINLIDFDNLRLHSPEIVFDFPAGGKRFVQRVEGYKYTIVSGEVIYQDGVPTGAMPGRVVRGGAALSA